MIPNVDFSRAFVTSPLCTLLRSQQNMNQPICHWGHFVTYLWSQTYLILVRQNSDRETKLQGEESICTELNDLGDNLIVLEALVTNCCFLFGLLFSRFTVAVCDRNLGRCFTKILILIAKPFPFNLTIHLQNFEKLCHTIFSNKMIVMGAVWCCSG